MLLMMIVNVVGSLTNEAAGVVAGILSIPLLKLLGEATYRLMDASLP